MKEHFQKLTDEGLADLKGNEAAVFNLEAENSFFLRLNANKVRQNTHIEQIILALRLQKDGKTMSIARTLSGNLEQDKRAVQAMLAEGRKDSESLPVDPLQMPLENNGTSSSEFKGRMLSPEDAIQSITDSAEGTDLAGLYCSGPVISANRNSAGQNHWFSTESFFMDYSLYNGEKAAKAVYAGSDWNSDEWKTNLNRAKNQLSLLSRPTQNIKLGQYRTYLAPGAVSEILSTMSWGGLSASAWKQGQSPFRKLAEGERKLSPKFSLRENFGLGLTPAFNGLGEVSEKIVSLIENGEFRQFLTSSRTAKEFSLKSNAASESEGMRSPEILPGSLEEKDILKALGTGLYLSNLHYLNWSDPNAARITGMTRYACFWVENGEIAGPIKDLRFDESLYDAFGDKLMDLTLGSEVDPAVMTYGARSLGGKKAPGMIINDWTFTL
ncbi:MAG: TldD/PmbA family protein [Bdellovibrionaceae bacterium]|nr:TldD/PmbA family protein [Pseudobdellovibrionaceae bacterium]